MHGFLIWEVKVDVKHAKRKSKILTYIDLYVRTPLILIKSLRYFRKRNSWLTSLIAANDEYTCRIQKTLNIEPFDRKPLSLPRTNHYLGLSCYIKCSKIFYFVLFYNQFKLKNTCAPASHIDTKRIQPNWYIQFSMWSYLFLLDQRLTYKIPGFILQHHTYSYSTSKTNQVIG